MHSHEPGIGLPPPPTRPTATHMRSHKPDGRLPLLFASPSCLEVRREIIRTVLCWIVYWSCAQS